MNTKYIKKNSLDMAEDIAYRWFSFIRTDPQISDKKHLALFLKLKILCASYNVIGEYADRLCNAVIKKWFQDCYNKLINDPDVQHHLVLLIEDLIINLNSLRK